MPANVLASCQKLLQNPCEHRPRLRGQSLIRSGRDIAITPDGPRGPRYSLGPGIILLAQTTGARIVPAHASFSRCVRMKTWDGFIIPLPFSKVSVTIGEALAIPAELTVEEFEAKRKNLEDLLKHAAD